MKMAQFIDLLDLDDKASFIALLMLEGLSRDEAEDAFQSLRHVYEKYQAVFDDLARVRYGYPGRYRVVETEVGPQVSESRAMVYDILDYHNQGATRGEIALYLNLKMPQVDVALEYIEQHRAVLEAELVEIKAFNAKEEAKYRARQEEIKAKLQALPMTKEQKAFYELREANQRKREQTHDNSTE
jgi:uncharacterized protein (DUF433 family)